MPAITTTASNETMCDSCMNNLGEMALRCKNCMCYIHLRCSDLPEYTLVRLMNTQNSYSCIKCVRTKEMLEEKFEEDILKLRELIAKEESSIEQLNREANDTVIDATRTEESTNLPSDETDPVSASSVNPVGVVATNNASFSVANRTTPENIVSKKKLCKYYVYRTCKHGQKGEGCSYNHPKKCLKFVNYGNKSNRGCKKGDKCAFFHPPLCWSSVDRGVCSRENCKFTHIIGTKFSQTMPIRNDHDRHIDTPARNERRIETPYASAVRSSLSRDSALRPAPEPVGVHRSQSNVENRNFLELRDQIQVMQSQIQQLLSMRVQSPLVTRDCSCGQNHQ